VINFIGSVEIKKNKIVVVHPKTSKTKKETLEW